MAIKGTFQLCIFIKIREISMKRFVLLLLFFCSSLIAEQQLSVCTIFQDDAPYLKEWIEFHKLQGVEHFYLYNNNSQDEFRTVLEPYIQKNEVTLTDWLFTYEEGAHKDWLAIQSGAYMDCVRNFGKETQWLACIDSDEFLFCPSGQMLPEFLKEYADFGGVCVNWLNFGTSHVEEIPPGFLMIELLTQCCEPTNPRNLFFKSIVQPKDVEGCKSAHVFIYREGKQGVTVNKKKIKRGERTAKVLIDKIRIHHYWTRTEQYFREKKIPSRIKRRPEFTVEIQMQMAEEFNQSRDTTILQFVDRLHKVLLP